MVLILKVIDLKAIAIRQEHLRLDFNIMEQNLNPEWLPARTFGCK